ncbi:hypothetical protein IJG79_02960 [Candidatus Saccharibacteria bacterium]|nr:hypothetical protein [Candidatus Saccharibacteria bacterium]
MENLGGPSATENTNSVANADNQSENLNATQVAESTENAGNVEKPEENLASKWDIVKEVEFNGNSAREKFYEQYYKEHPEEVHQLVENFLDQKMAEADEHHAEEMTRIVETQTDGWTEDDSAKLREIEAREQKKQETPAEDAIAEETSAEETSTEETSAEETSAEEEPSESAEQILAKMYEETHQSKEEPAAEESAAEEPASEAPVTSEQVSEEQVSEESDFGKHGETQFNVVENYDKVKDQAEITTPDGESLTVEVDKSKSINPEKYLVYSLSDSTQEAIPRDKLIEAYRDKIEQATDAKKYFEATRLSNQIMHEYQDNPEIIAQIKAIESTDIYQKNRTNAELETAKKVMSKRSEDLVHAQEEYDKLNKGGLLKKMMNRMARKTAKSRLEWTQRDITNAQNDIARLEAQMAQFGNTSAASTTEVEQAQTNPNQTSANKVPVTQNSAEHPNIVNFQEKAAQNQRFINEPVKSTSAYPRAATGNLAGQFVGDDREENAA